MVRFRSPKSFSALCLLNRRNSSRCYLPAYDNRGCEKALRSRAGLHIRECLWTFAARTRVETVALPRLADGWDGSHRAFDRRFRSRRDNDGAVAGDLRFGTSDGWRAGHAKDKGAEA